MLLDLLDPDLRVVLLTARPERVHHLTEAWLRRYQIRWDVLLMRPWGDYEMARDFKQASVWDLRHYGFELRLAIEDDRRNVDDVPLRGRPLHLLPLRLLRLSCLSIPGRIGNARPCARRSPGVRARSRARRGEQTMKNALKTAVLLAALGALFMLVGGR